MKNLISFIRDKHQILFKVFLFLLATGLIVFIFPREGKFKYEFTKGKPWPHEDLIATFDYTIYKSDEQISLERERILENKSIYFFKSGKVKTESITQFDLDFESEWDQFLEEFFRLVHKKRHKKGTGSDLKNIYQVEMNRLYL